MRGRYDNNRLDIFLSAPHNDGMISAASTSPHQRLDPSSGERDACPNADTMEWTVFLLREQPHKAAGVALVFALILLWSILTFHNVLVGLAACVAVAGVVKEYILPLRFRLTTECAAVACAGIPWIELPWAAVLSIYRTPAGLKLSPHADPKLARTENLRGLTLRFPPNMAPGVEEFVERMSGAANLGIQ
jgi:hypothetical protein